MHNFEIMKWTLMGGRYNSDLLIAMKSNSAHKVCNYRKRLACINNCSILIKSCIEIMLDFVKYRMAFSKLQLVIKHRSTSKP